MRNHYLIFIVTVFLVAPTLVKAEKLSDKIDCGNSGGTMLEINYCAAEQFKLADNELNSLFKEKIAALETVSVKKRLRDSQRTWISFRDSACLYEAGPREESGSI